MNSLLMLFIFVPILVLILLALNLIFATHNPDSEKNQPYECGFTPDYSPTFFIFSIHHFNTCLCFLVFDLEITLFFPISVTMSGVSLFGTSVALLFFAVLTLGFILELSQSVIRLTDLTLLKDVNLKASGTADRN